MTDENIIIGNDEPMEEPHVNDYSFTQSSPMAEEVNAFAQNDVVSIQVQNSTCGWISEDGNATNDIDSSATIEDDNPYNSDGGSLYNTESEGVSTSDNEGKSAKEDGGEEKTPMLEKVDIEERKQQTFGGRMKHLYCPKCGHSWYSPSWDRWCPKTGCTGSPQEV